MNKELTVFAIIILCFAVYAPSVYSYRGYSYGKSPYSLGAKIGLVFSDTENEYLDATGLGGSFSGWSPNQLPALDLFFQYHISDMFSAEIGYEGNYLKISGDIDDTLRMNSFKSSLIVGKLQTSSSLRYLRSKYSLYGKAGVVYGNLSSDLYEMNDSKIGFEIGAGVDIPIYRSNYSLIMEATYKNLQFEDDYGTDLNASGLKLSIGARIFGF
jgi:hypothetical protein